MLYIVQNVLLIMLAWLSSFSAFALSAFSVEDDLGNQLVFKQPVNRIIALSPHLAELVYEAGAGDRLVATVDFADFPAPAKQVQRVGAHNSWDLEKIMALKPDVVLVWLSARGQTAVDQLKRLGLKVYISEPRALADISRTVRDIGKMTGMQAIAEISAQKFDTKLNDLREQFQGRNKIRLFYQVWGGPLVTINARQLISRVLELCGGENIFAGLTALAPVVSREALLLKNPQVIIGAADKTVQQDWLNEWLNWSSIEAVSKGHLFFIEPDLLHRQTSRILLGARQVCEYLEQVRSGAE